MTARRAAPAMCEPRSATLHFGSHIVFCLILHFYELFLSNNLDRFNLIDNNFIDCIIQLPSNLFFGTSIATCIMVLKRGKKDNHTMFIDATNECIKITNNNKLMPENITRIVDTFAQRREEKHFSRLVDFNDIVENDYTLSVSTYVEAKDTREKVDIVKLNAEIERIVTREESLRKEIATIIKEIGEK